MDTQTVSVIAAIIVVMFAQTGILYKHINSRIDSAKGELGARIDGLQAEVAELKATVTKMDGRLYDLATGRRTPLIVPDH